MNRKLRIIGYILGTICLILANAVFIAANWAVAQFPDMDFTNIAFHLKVPLQGANTTTFTGIIVKCAVIAPVISLAGLWAALKFKSDQALILHIFKLEIRLPLDFWHRHYFLLSLIFSLVSAGANLHALGADVYLVNQLSRSSFIEDHYADPREVTLTFPEEKRNLIYLFLESMENTFASPEYGGDTYTNLIPELTGLQLDHPENISFTASETGLNGAYATTGTTWTIGAIVAQTSGIPLCIPIDGNAMSEYDFFLPGAYSIGEVLGSAGYTQAFLIGSNATFGGRKLYLLQHGNYQLMDYFYAVHQGWIPEDYFVNWGYEDQKLFENAKETLLSLAQGQEPFNLTILTVDSHFPDGYACDLCIDLYGNQYSNTITCCDHQIADFIRWIQEQDFYENTTIVLCGDHPTMNDAYVQEITCYYGAYDRTVYTTIINSAAEYTLDYDRTFTTLDMYPTTLAALGIQMEGERMGLGVNLFSDTPTLIEQYGIEAMNEEFSKTSSFYNNKLLYR